MNKIAAVVLVGISLAAGASLAQTRDFTETFTTQASASSWWVVRDSSPFLPAWEDATDPYIWATLTNSAAWVYADDTSSDGKLVGDYAAAGIASIHVDMAVAHPLELFDLEIYFRTSYQDRFYRIGLWLPTDSSWYRYTVPVDHTNWYCTAEGYGTPPVEALIAVTEVGLVAYPRDGATVRNYLSIDNFGLTPKLIAPLLSLDFEGSTHTYRNRPRIKFRALRGQSYTVQRCEDLLGSAWRRITGVVGDDGVVSVVDTNFTSMCHYRVASILIGSGGAQ